MTVTTAASHHLSNGCRLVASDALLGSGRIGPNDLDLITLTDDLEEVVEVIAASE